MKMTKHARQKQRRRGMTNFDLEVIECYGTLENAPGGAIKIFVGKRERQKIIGYLKLDLVVSAHLRVKKWTLSRIK
jgi:hypothetical protein